MLNIGATKWIIRMIKLSWFTGYVGGSCEHSLKIPNILDIAELMQKQCFLRGNIVG